MKDLWVDHIIYTNVKEIIVTSRRNQVRVEDLPDGQWKMNACLQDRLEIARMFPIVSIGVYKRRGVNSLCQSVDLDREKWSRR